MANMLPRIVSKLRRTAAPFARHLGQLRAHNYPVGTTFLYKRKSHVFAGYYDVCPLDNAQRLLALSCTQDNASPHDTNIVAEIGYFDLTSPQPDFVKITTTNTWNWQQGCRLQWRPEHKNHFIFNTSANGTFRSKIVDAASGQVLKTLDRPIYALHPNGKQALSLNFSRLHHFRRGYGYHQQYEQSTIDTPCPANDGLWLLDIDNNSAELALSLREIADTNPTEDMAGKFHYINHAQFSPSGDKIIFFHLWVNDKGKRQSRLMMLSKDKVLLVIDPSLRPSHTAWQNENSIIVTGIRSNTKGITHIYDLSQADSKTTPLTLSFPMEDTHPTFITQSEFLGDTYPTIWGRQNLFIADMKGTHQTIASFYVPPEYSGECRCDTHPRLTSDKRKAILDIVINHKRAIAIIPLPEKRLTAP